MCKIDKVVEAKAQLSCAVLRLVAVFGLIPPPTHPHKLNLAVSQPPVVQSEHVRTFFDSTKSEGSKSGLSTQKFYAATRIKTHLDNALYLSSLWSDLSM